MPLIWSVALVTHTVVSVSAVTHAARPLALERPAFMQKNGLTGAERGTAIHAFLQSVPFHTEVLDLDAMTGGFNLQIAWSTGHLAGMCEV